jgi:hypothetical protein
MKIYRGGYDIVTREPSPCFIITTEDRIITAVMVNNGAYVDGTQFNELMELTQKAGLP